MSQHRELVTAIADFIQDESTILILTSLSWDCLYRNRLHRMEISIYVDSLRVYNFTLWREEEQQRELGAYLDLSLGPTWDW